MSFLVFDLSWPLYSGKTMNYQIHMHMSMCSYMCVYMYIFCVIYVCDYMSKYCMMYIYV